MLAELGEPRFEMDGHYKNYSLMLKLACSRASVLIVPGNIHTVVKKRTVNTLMMFAIMVWKLFTKPIWTWGLVEMTHIYVLFINLFNGKPAN